MTEQTELSVRRPLEDARERVQEGERELGSILTHMWENAEILLRQELDLGLKELDLKADKLKHSLLLGSIGTLAVYAGLLALLASLILGLSKVMEPWLAALIVGSVVTAAGATFLMRGESKAESIQTQAQTPRTTRTMKEAIK